MRVEFTRPAKPQDNGAHEQMHRVLKAETSQPPAAHPALHPEDPGGLRPATYARPAAPSPPPAVKHVVAAKV